MSTAQSIATHAHVKSHRTGGRRAETLITHVSLRGKRKLRPVQEELGAIGVGLGAPAECGSAAIGFGKHAVIADPQLLRYR
ncbi:MAG: hypothetical protein FWE39_13660 [Nocardiaceae bacterium]|nr:hypothetical protein [Nocardiaceae bacterium]